MIYTSELLVISDPRLLNGQRKKERVQIDGMDYVMKFISETELCSEYMYYLVGKALGIPIAETHICPINNKLVLLSQITGKLTSGTTLIKQAGFTSYNFLKRKNDEETFMYSFDEILNLLNKDSKSSLVLMSALDCIMSNGDRHSENWGTVLNSLYPSFDHNLALSTTVDEEYSMIRLDGDDITLLELWNYLFKSYAYLLQEFDLRIVNRQLFKEMEAVISSKEIDSNYEVLSQNIKILISQIHSFRFC